jgi:hypothetical protein
LRRATFPALHDSIFVNLNLDPLLTPICKRINRVKGGSRIRHGMVIDAIGNDLNAWELIQGLKKDQVCYEPVPPQLTWIRHDFKERPRILIRIAIVDIELLARSGQQPCAKPVQSGGQKSIVAGNTEMLW